MKSQNHNRKTIQICQSLIQKAIRRGNVEMTLKAASYLIQADEFEWVRRRLAVLTFEECWPFGLNVSFEANEKIILDQVIRLAGTIKNRNAAGLGSLAYNLSIGDQSVLNGSPEDNEIKLMADALQSPELFWKASLTQPLNHYQKALMENAYEAFALAVEPWDKAFTLAAAHLAVKEDVAPVKSDGSLPGSEFPLWIAIDMHTPEGTRAIRESARQIGFDADKALWLIFYLEGAKCKTIENSPWWDREKLWRMNDLGLTMIAAVETWERLRPVVIELLKEEVDNLSAEID